MAENVAITAGSGTPIAVDLIGGDNFQRVKHALGRDGVWTADQAGADLGSGDGAAYVRPRPAANNIQVASAGLTTASTAYVANDTLGTILTFANAVLLSGATGTIQSATLVDKAAIVGWVDLYLFDRSVTLATDNATAAFSDADMLFCQGIISFPPPQGGTGNGFSQVHNAGVQIKPNATSLFGALVTRAAHTFFGAAGDLVVTLGIQQD